jgi:DNA-binding transcriptional LysR family regulator
MSRLDINRSGEMEVFVRVVDLGALSAAARELRMTPSAVSKLLSRLETRLGTRLINRSTRKLQLTPEGCTFYERSIRILAEIAEAERYASAGEQPAGRIHINTSASFSNHILAPLVPEFLRQHPGVTLDISVTDLVVDLMQERADVAIRAGPMKSSQLIARKLGGTRMAIVAAPTYLARHGTPTSAGELAGHFKIAFSYQRAIEGWPLIADGERIVAPLDNPLRANDGEAMRHLALAGAGLVRLAGFTVRRDIDAGLLTEVMEASNPGDIEDFYAVYIGQGGPLPARIRALLDFLGENVRLC